VIADYDGDFKDDLATYSPRIQLAGALYRAVAGTWTIQRSATNTVDTQFWGGAFGDLPVPADYDATANPSCDIETSFASCHTADLAVWNNFTGNWTIRNGNGSARIQQWGQTGDIPVPR